MIDLEKILELESKASGAPWDEMHFDTYCCAVGPECVEQKQARKDQDLINLMRNNIRQICLELQSAREFIELVNNIDFECHGENDCEYDDSELDNDKPCTCGGLEIRKKLQNYIEVTNGKC